MSAHDRYLAAYRTYETTVWCANPACAHHTEPVQVRYESEYGQGWLTPEECWACGGEWLEDAPPAPDEGEDDDDALPPSGSDQEMWLMQDMPELYAEADDDA